MNNVVCVNWGTKYSVEYTLRLYNMVKRNTTKNFKFYVLTDVVDRYSKYDFITAIELDTDLVGWWNKLLLFKRGTLPEGEYLYLDLDVVITDNIDCFFDHPSFGITRDFIRPSEGLLPGPEFNSSALRFNNTTTDGIWQYYISNKKYWHAQQKQIHFFGDQNLISSYVNAYPDYLNVFPDEWLWSLRKGQGRGDTAGDRSKWFGNRVPVGGKICVCHGNPSPQEVLDNPEKWQPFADEKCLVWLKKHYK